MKLYRPVPITSAEQAEALPVGTVLRHESYQPIEKWDHNGEAIYGGFQDDLFPDELVGWLALVPIEAEEEATAPFRGLGGVFHVSRSTGSFPHPQRRLVTPWEEA